MSREEKKPPTTDRGVTSTPSKELSVAYASIDYYTATTRDSQIGVKWHDVWIGHRAEAAKTGGRVKVFRRYGYDMMMVAGLTYGFSTEQGHLLTASSQTAHLTWQKVLPTASNITRVDIQYTFKVLDWQKERSPVAWAWDEVKDDERRGSTRIINSKGGETLYIGSRRSDQYGRFYNKSIESGLDVKDIYRLEVEYKSPRSAAWFDRWYKELKGGATDATLLKNEVCSWFERRGVDVGIDFGRVEPIQISKTVTDEKRQLRWLKTSVQPTIRELSGRGKLKELAEAIGLDGSDYRQMAMFVLQETGTECKHHLNAKNVCIKCGLAKTEVYVRQQKITD